MFLTMWKICWASNVDILQMYGMTWHTISDRFTYEHSAFPAKIQPTIVCLPQTNIFPQHHLMNARLWGIDGINYFHFKRESRWSCDVKHFSQDGKRRVEIFLYRHKKRLEGFFLRVEKFHCDWRNLLSEYFYATRNTSTAEMNVHQTAIETWLRGVKLCSLFYRCFGSALEKLSNASSCWLAPLDIKINCIVLSC